MQAILPMSLSFISPSSIGIERPLPVDSQQSCDENQISWQGQGDIGPTISNGVAGEEDDQGEIHTSYNLMASLLISVHNIRPTTIKRRRGHLSKPNNFVNQVDKTPRLTRSKGKTSMKRKKKDSDGDDDALSQLPLLAGPAPGKITTAVSCIIA